RIVQEALTNIARHAQTRTAEVALSSDDASLTVSIRDKGVGFDPGQQSASSGLSSMRERAELVSGTIEITSQSESGVEVIASLPLPADHPKPDNPEPHA
ncbi:MAG: ATP-binding protein, partial [Chloroflexota bacterium]|nr:ATP-binding protein [Chloroflexota bacterium]